MKMMHSNNVRNGTSATPDSGLQTSNLMSYVDGLKKVTNQKQKIRAP